MLKIDLGSGGCKPEGFVGVDRHPLDNVDVVADLDAPLPFSSDSVDLVYASHSLEHVHDLMATMREVYRVCKHGAQLCIVAPYNEQKLNLANPYHISRFNEHTPRFWTDYPEAPIDPKEYAHPHADRWGLSRSDHSNPGLDLRLVRLEFFYFPQFRFLPPDDLRTLRNERLDVCDQIMYHLIVWKGDDQSPGKSFSDHVAAFVPFEPEFVKHRKASEQTSLLLALTGELDKARSKTALEAQLVRKNEVFHAASVLELPVKELESDLDRANRYAADVRTLCDQLSGSRQTISELRDDIWALRDQTRLDHVTTQEKIDSLCLQLSEFARASLELSNENLILRERVSTLTDYSGEVLGELRKMRSEDLNLRQQIESIESLKSKIALLNVEVESSNGLLSWYQSHTASLSSEISSVQARLSELHLAQNRWDDARRTVSQLYGEMTSRRPSMFSRFTFYLSPHDALWDSVSPAFVGIKTYTSNHFKKTRSTRFILGDDLGMTPYREYTILFDLVRLSKVSLAVRPVLTPSHGSVGIEIVTNGEQIVANVSIPLVDVSPDVPTEFILPQTLDNVCGPWFLRVYCKDTDVPVALFELTSFSLFSSSNVAHLPFVSFD